MRGIIYEIGGSSAGETQRLQEVVLKRAAPHRPNVDAKFGEITPGHDNRSAHVQLFIRVHRDAWKETEEGDASMEQNVVEFEELRLLIFAPEKRVVALTPTLLTRVLSPKKVTDLAISFLAECYAAAGLDVSLTELEVESTRGEMIAAVLEAARFKHLRVVRVDVSAFGGKQASDELTMFNPDPDPEAMLQSVFPKASKGIASATFRAPQDDLSHTALMRGAMASGIIDQVVIVNDESKTKRVLKNRRPSALNVRDGDPFDLLRQVRMTLTDDRDDE